MTNAISLEVAPVREVALNNRSVVDINTPCITFEDYALLNFVFDNALNEQLLDFLQNEKVQLNEIHDLIGKLNQRQQQNPFIPVGNYTITGFINSSFITALTGFNSVYGDEVWSKILYAQNIVEEKISQVINLNFGKESQIVPNIKSLIPLDPSQEKAMQYALLSDNELTVIKGPPGTGKSQVIVSILSQILKQNKKALFVSSKKVALEVVTKKIAEFEQNLDNKLRPNADNNKLLSLNDRILDLNAANVKRNNFLVNAIRDIRDKQRYESSELLPTIENPLAQYSELLNRIQIDNLTHENRVLSQMLRYKFQINTNEGIILPNRVRGNIHLDDLQKLLDTDFANQYDQFVNHCFNTLERDQIQNLINDLNDNKIQNLNLLANFTIQNPQESITNNLQNTISLLEAV